MTSVEAVDSQSEPYGAANKTHRLLIKFGFTTAEDLAQLRHEADAFAVNAVVTFCDDPKAERYGHVGYAPVYSEGSEITFGPGPAAIQEKGTPRTYHSYASVIEKRVRSWNCSGSACIGLSSEGPRQQGWDLRDEPKDLCLNVELPIYMRGRYRSNTVVISRNAIRAALGNMPAKFRGNPELDEMGRLKARQGK